MARPRLPRQLKIIRGTFRGKREPAHVAEPEKVTEIPPAPEWLRPLAKAEWEKRAAELVAQGLLTTLDLTTLELTCAAYGTFREAYDAVYKQSGKPRSLAKYMEPRSQQTSLELATMRACLALYKSYLTEFGLSPASRGRIGVKAPEKKATDPMEALLNEA